MRENRSAQTSSTPIVQEVTPQEIVVNTLVPRRSGRVIVPPSRYMLLGESCDMIPEEQQAEPCNCNEALQDKDAEL